MWPKARAERVNKDTPIVSRGHARLVVFVALIGFGLTACATSPSSLGPRVVWVSGERAYVALRDSAALETGDRVSFQRKGTTIATGSVARVERDEMALVAIESGSLSEEKNLERLDVVPERPPVVAPTLLRIGLPSAARKTLFFGCSEVRVRPQWPESAYRSISTSPRLIQLVRNTAIPLRRLWPDTLRFRFYDESTDQEIALERGELDVAVFWPGELSKHMRQAPRWRDLLWSSRMSGIVSLEGEGPGFHSARAYWQTHLFAPLNRDLFSGDLSPVPIPAGSDTVTVPTDWNLVVDRSACPGHRELQRYIDRAMPARATTGARRQALLSFRGFLASFRPDYSSRSRLGVFLVRCPAVCDPRLRRYVSDLTRPDGLAENGLAELIDCRDGS